MKIIIFILLLSVLNYADSCTPEDISCDPGEEGCEFTSITSDCPGLCSFDGVCNITGFCYQVEIIPLTIYTTRCEAYIFQDRECINGTYKHTESGAVYNGLTGFLPIQTESYIVFEDAYKNCSVSYDKYGFGSGEEAFNKSMIFFIDLVLIIFLLTFLNAITYKA